MASDVAGPVQLDLVGPVEQPRTVVAVLVGAVMAAMVAGGAVLAFAPLFPRAAPAGLTLTGHASTAGAGPLRSGRRSQAYLVVRNGTGGPVRIVGLRPDLPRLRPGSAGADCRPEALTVRVGKVGLDVGTNQAALLTIEVTLDRGAAIACRGAVFDLPVTALARPAAGR
jgi:hypothetical protein